MRLKDYRLLHLLVDLCRREEYTKAKMYSDRFYDEALENESDMDSAEPCE